MIVPCDATGPHHGDRCTGGRVQSPNAQFTRDCPVCRGTGERTVIEITFKTPDAIDPLFPDELREKLSKWIQYGEYVTLLYDPARDTMEVKKCTQPR